MLQQDTHTRNLDCCFLTSKKGYRQRKTTSTRLIIQSSSRQFSFTNLNLNYFTNKSYENQEKKKESKPFLSTKKENAMLKPYSLDIVLS